MFLIYRTKLAVPKSIKKSYTTYEAARSAIRKWIRANKTNKQRNKSWSDTLYNNPSISHYGFTIKKVG